MTNERPSFFTLGNINLTVRLLTAADTVIGTALGMLAPIFAVFIEDKIPGGTVEVVGIATGVYLFTRSVAQLPIARIIDKKKGEFDDFVLLAGGWFVFALVPLAYLFMTSVFQLYLIQFVYGLSAAIFFPAWSALFTRHIDKGKEAFEWGVYQTTVDISGAFAASLGGFVAVRYGFDVLLIAMTILSFISWFFILGVRNDIRNASGKKPE